MPRKPKTTPDTTTLHLDDGKDWRKVTVIGGDGEPLGDLVGSTVRIGEEERPVVVNTEGEWSFSVAKDFLHVIGPDGKPYEVPLLDQVVKPPAYTVLLSPFTGLAFPPLPEPDLSDEARAAITAALEQMRDKDADPIAVVLEGVDLAQTSTALRRTAERMGLGVTFYVRAAREAVAPEVGVRGVVRHHGREASPAALMVARRKP